MRRTGWSACLLVAAVTALPGPAPAQAKPNFTGTWVMVPERSDLAGMPSAGNRTDVIDHREPKLTIERTVGDGKTLTLDRTIKVQGQSIPRKLVFAKQ